MLSNSVMSNSLQLHGLYRLPGSSAHGDSPGKNTVVGCHVLFQGIFPIQGSNPGLPHCRWILYYLSHQGKPRILEWVAYPFSKGSSQLRNWTGVSGIEYKFFTSLSYEGTQSFLYLDLNLSSCSYLLIFPHFLSFFLKKKKHSRLHFFYL